MKFAELIALLLLTTTVFACHEGSRLSDFTLELTLDDDVSCNITSLSVQMPEYGNRVISLGSRNVENGRSRFSGQVEGERHAVISLDSTEFHMILHPGTIKFHFGADKWVVVGSKSNGHVAHSITRLHEITTERRCLARDYLTAPDSIVPDVQADLRLWQRDSILADEATFIVNSLSDIERNVLSHHTY